MYMYKVQQGSAKNKIGDILSFFFFFFLIFIMETYVWVLVRIASKYPKRIFLSGILRKLCQINPF